MAEVIGVINSAEILKLGERVEAALKEYEVVTRFATLSPRELRDRFGKLNKSYRALYERFSELDPAEKEIVNTAGQELQAAAPGQHWLSGFTDAIETLEKIGVLIRQAQKQLPKVTHGPQIDKAKQRLITRLGIIYGQTNPEIQSDGSVRHEMPTRRHNPYNGRDYGPFREFVILAFEALGFDIPEQGVDDVIRAVWSNMGKKRR